MKKLPTLLHITSGRVRLAVGRAVSGGFLVYAGSHASSSATTSTPANAVKLRLALRDAGVLVESDKHLVFVQDFTFGSSSVAASVVMGKSASGNAEWKPLT